MKKKWTAAVLAAAMIVSPAFAAGCSSGATQSASTAQSVGASQEAVAAKKPIELKFWYCYQDVIAQNNKDLTKKFNDTIGKEKGIHVTAEFQGGYSDLQSKLQSAFVGNVEPAVSVMEISVIQQFATGGMIQPLDDVIADKDVKDFYPGLMENCYVDKKLYAVPYLRSTPILYYNKTLFKKAGLNPDKGPSDWDELNSMSQAIAKAGAKGYGFVSDEWYSEAFIRCDGGDTMDAGQTQFTFNSPQGIAMQQFFRDGIKNNNFKYYTGANGGDSLDTDSMNQKIAMWCGSTAGLPNTLSLAKQKGFEIGTAFIPKKVQNKVPTGGCNLVMTGRLQGEKKDAAAAFINFMTSSESAVTSHIKTGYLPTRQSIGSDPKLIALYQKTPQFKVAFDQLKYASGRPMVEGYSEGITHAYLNAMDKIMTTNVDIKTTLDAAKAKCDPLLK